MIVHSWENHMENNDILTYCFCCEHVGIIYGNLSSCGCSGGKGATDATKYFPNHKYWLGKNMWQVAASMARDFVQRIYLSIYTVNIQRHIVSIYT